MLRTVWALMEYQRNVHVGGPFLPRMAESLKPDNGIESDRIMTYVTESLNRM